MYCRYTKTSIWDQNSTCPLDEFYCVILSEDTHYNQITVIKGCGNVHFMFFLSSQ